MFRCFQTYCTFATVNYGALAHLARVRHWQCRGGEFESRMLHITSLSVSEGFVFS